MQMSDIDTCAERYAEELASSGAVHTRYPLVRVWTLTATP